MSPRRDSAAGRAYLDLEALARRAGRPAQEYLVMYVHERFLYRLALWRHRDRMILKGGMLLAALDTRRPTADIDLLATALRNDVATVAAAVREVLAIDADDGVVFSPDRLTSRVNAMRPGRRSAASWNAPGAGESVAIASRCGAHSPAMVDWARAVLHASDHGRRRVRRPHLDRSCGSVDGAGAPLGVKP